MCKLECPDLHMVVIVLQSKYQSSDIVDSQLSEHEGRLIVLQSKKYQNIRRTRILLLDVFVVQETQTKLFTPPDFKNQHQISSRDTQTQTLKQWWKFDKLKPGR